MGMDNSQVKSLIEQFIFNYEKNGVKIYLEELKENLQTLNNQFIIDFNDIRAFNKDLADALIKDKSLLDSLNYFIYEIHMIKYEEKDGKYVRTNQLMEYANKVDFNDFKVVIKNYPVNAGLYRPEFKIDGKTINELVFDFIKTCKKNDRLAYLDQLLYNIKFRNKVFVLDIEDLQKFNIKLAQLIVSDKDALEEFKKALYDLHCSKWIEKDGNYEPSIFLSGYCSQIKESEFELVFENQALNVRIRDIGTKINKPGAVVRLRGIVISKSDVKFRLIRAHYIHQDPSCMYEWDFPDEETLSASGESIIENLDLKSPICPMCGKSKNIVLIPEKSEYEAWQKIIIQEPSDELESSETPRQISIDLVGPLVDTVHIGDKIEVVGVLKVKNKPQKVNNNLVFDKFVRAISVKILETTNLDVAISEDDEKKIIELSKRKDIIELIIRSIAPSIYGMEFEKEAVALSLFSGVTKVRADQVVRRGNIHSLIIGDPGLAKSQILIFISKIMPRAQYVDCKNASGVGLTATAVMDPDLKEWRIDAGAFVLADNSVVLLDEVDKLPKEDREHLNIPMEQQIVAVQKADKSARLFSRVAVIAVSNPKWKRWVKDKSIEDNIPFEPDFLSRFDIISIIKDEVDEERDRKLLEHIRKVETGSLDSAYIDFDLLRKYIIYARKNVFPQMTEEAYKMLENFWLEARQKTKDSILQFTPRQLEALIRISEAYARMRLSDKVEVQDAERAIRFMQRMLSKLNIDIETGLSQETFDKIMKIYNIIDALSHSPVKNGVAELGDILLNAKEQYGLNEDEVMKIINYLRQNGKIREVEKNKYVPA